MSNLISVKGIEHTSGAFRAKVIDIGAELEVDPNFLMAIMSFETGGTFDPAQRNLAGSGATGLIQFMPSTAKALGTSVEKLAAMTAEDQLDVVALYFKPFRGRLVTLEDAYMAVLFPVAIGKGPAHILFRRGEIAYKQNRGLDLNGDGKITVGEATAKVRERLGGAVTGSDGELRRGDRGPEVQVLQHELIDLGHLSVASSNTGPGIFGPRTEAALRAFQAAVELAPTGIYDTSTRAAVIELDLGVRRGSLSGVVLPLQHRLISHDLLSAEAVARAPGTFGPLTEQALIAFQTSHDLEPSGILNDATYRLLFEVEPEPLKPDTGEPAVGRVFHIAELSIPSYQGATYTILDNLALVREPHDLHMICRFDSGDPLPPGKAVGDRKVIPMFTGIRVTDVRTDENRDTYVLAEPVDAGSMAPSGWTKATNLEGQFLNELVGCMPVEWDLAPQGNNYTVTDLKSLVRSGPPDFRSQGSTIETGTYVVVTGRSEHTDPTGKFVAVSRGRIEDGALPALEPLGWTSASNLTDGCSTVFKTDAWLGETGPNACWRRGRFIGAKILVNIVGTGGQMEQLTLDSVSAFVNLKDAAANDGIVMGVVSGFRTFRQQKKLFDRFLQGFGNLAARPGRSNHQHGQAFDLNTGGFEGNPVYDWLKKNGPRLGFIRTVNGEHWHWEYRPIDAARLAAKGKFKLSSVRQ